MKKFEKKGLTARLNSGILCKLSDGSTGNGAETGSGPNLENDTEGKKRAGKEDSEDSEELNVEGAEAAET